MTVLLVAIESVKSRMVMASEQLGVNPAITSAIIAAQLRIEAELDTSLTYQDSEDTYQINPELFGGVIPAGNLWRLYLKNGLVSEDKPVEVSYSRSRTGVYSPLSESDFEIDYDKGLVFISAGIHDLDFIKVKYSSGFETDTAPDWLVEAILGYVPTCLSLGPAADPKKTAPYEDSLRHAQILLHRHLRNVGSVFRAIY